MPGYKALPDNAVREERRNAISIRYPESNYSRSRIPHMPPDSPLTAKQGTYNDNDPIGVLDVTILSNLVLDKILGIKDLRTDKRIDFVGGIRGLGELKRRVDSGEMKVAFALYPVSMKQIIDIADSGNIMPPKTTWFEPKLRSGLAIHVLE